MSYIWVKCTDGQTCCVKSTNSTCNQARLLQGIPISPTHDAQLEETSKKINQLLEEARGSNHDPEKELALLSVPDEHSDGTLLLLEWVSGGGVSADSSIADFKKAFQIN